MKPASHQIRLSNPFQNPTHRALFGLRKVLGNSNAVFKMPEQQLLVESVLGGHHTIAVLPTGAGKSMAFEIPPNVDGRLTLVVVPFRAIVTQIIENAGNRGTMVEQWTARSHLDASKCRLVVLAVETAVSKNFSL
jgi:superfamily II DNA helicase RecQ